MINMDEKNFDALQGAYSTKVILKKKKSLVNAPARKKERDLIFIPFDLLLNSFYMR